MLALYIVHWIINPLLIVSAHHIFVGHVHRLRLETVFLAAFFLLIYCRALEIYIEAFDIAEFLFSVWFIPYLIILISVPVRCALQALPTRGNPAGITSPDLDRSLRRHAWKATAGVVLLPVVFSLDKGLSNLAILAALFAPGDTVAAMNLRMGGLESNVSPVLTLAYSYGRTVILPAFLAVLGAARARHIISSFHLIIACTAVGVFCLMQAEKAPVVISLIGVVLAFALASPKRPSWRRLGLVGIAVLLVPAPIYPLLAGRTDLGEAVFYAIASVWRRLTWVPSFVSASYFDAFSQHFRHVGLASNRFLAKLADLPYEGTAGVMADEYFRFGIQGGRANASYFASFYADWGLAGVIVGTVVVAILLALIQDVFDRSRMDSVAIGFRAATCVAVWQLMISDLFSVSLGRGFVSLCVVLVAVRVGTVWLRVVRGPKTKVHGSIVSPVM